MGAALDFIKKRSTMSSGKSKDVVGGASGEGYTNDDDDAEGMPLDDNDHEDAASFETLADHLGIDDDKREGARAALKSYVKACMRSKGSDTEEE